MHKPFNYKTEAEFINDAVRNRLPYSKDLSSLLTPVVIYGKKADNRIALQPMEGCDGNADGSPAELTIRRYERFAAGGAGLIWVEATAVTNEGRANPRQLWINEDNKESFKSLLDTILKISADTNGIRPYTVIQLTHSGRYCKPGNAFAPIVARRNNYLDREGLEYKIITDAELDALVDKYVSAAIMCKEIGFDAVDIKCCHGYLLCELLGAFTRDGKYGGSFENRTRLLLTIIDEVKKATGMDITLRMNAYDEVPHPFGFSADKDDYKKPDIYEAKKLVSLLAEKGVELINITAGNPYYNPHVNRPYDKGFYIPQEEPMEHLAKMHHVTAELKKEAKNVTFISSAFSWMREYGANVAAGGINEGMYDIAGFGRQAFAYPDFANDIREKSGMNPRKCCITCGKCSEIMRFGGETGCLIHDAGVYAPLYKKYSAGKETLISSREGDHV